MAQNTSNNLDRIVRDGSLDRRTFLKQASALGLGTAAAGLLAIPAGRGWAAQPKRGGRLRAAMSTDGPDDTLDPAKSKAGIDYCRIYQIYNPLVDIDGDGRIDPQPALATHWEHNSDATQWVFKLRKGVEFHNGKSFTAADVVYTFRRLLDPDFASTGKQFVKGVKTVEAEDKHTVRFTLDGPNVDFPVNLGVVKLFIVPDGHTDFNGNPVGTGPFVMKEFRPGIRSVAVRNENYWREGKPYLDELEWFAIADPVARLNALLSGGIHLMAELSAKSIPVVKSTDDCHVLATKAGQFVDVVMMLDREPFKNNLDAVTGIKYLFDREKILNRVLRGYGMLGNDQPISPLDPMYCDEIPIRPYDPDKAKHYLKKGGVYGSTLTLHTSNAAQANAVDIGLELARSAHSIGMDIEVQREPAAGYWSDIWMKKPFHMAGWNMRPTANIMLTIAAYSTAAWNESRFKSERFDKLLVESRGVTDIAKRQEMYCEMQRLIRDQAGLGLPAFIDYIDAASDKVKGVPDFPLGPLGGYSFPEHVWLDT